MTLAPPRPPSRDELEALIREARTRQRKRRTVGVAALAVAAAATIGIYAGLTREGATTRNKGGRSQAVGTPSRCRSAELRLGAPRFNGAFTGHAVTGYTFTNVSAATCTLRGWPALGIWQGGHALRVSSAHWQNETPSRTLPVRRVALRPGAAASFNVVTSDFDPQNDMGPWPCTARGFVMLVTPPGARVPLRRPERTAYCGPTHGAAFGVTPVVAGRLDHHIAG